MIAIDLSKQQALDADPKEIQQISFTSNLDRDGDTTMFLLLEKRKKPFQIFQKELLKYCECRPTTQLLRVPQLYFVLI